MQRPIIINGSFQVNSNTKKWNNLFPWLIYRYSGRFQKFILQNIRLLFSPSICTWRGPMFCYIINGKILQLHLIKNVSTSTSHKKTLSLRLSVFTSFRPSLREFKKILLNTFIYQSILIKKIYEYQYYEYENISLKEVWPQRSLKVTKVHPILALTQPFP